MKTSCRAREGAQGRNRVRTVAHGRVCRDRLWISNTSTFTEGSIDFLAMAAGMIAHTARLDFVSVLALVLDRTSPSSSSCTCTYLELRAPPRHKLPTIRGSRD